MIKSGEFKPSSPEMPIEMHLKLQIVYFTLYMSGLVDSPLISSNILIYNVFCSTLQVASLKPRVHHGFGRIRISSLSRDSLLGCIRQSSEGFGTPAHAQSIQNVLWLQRFFTM